ncbi:MAG TPA: DNRLRE domain-containing protein [Spirochaetota bacterium]|jgi:hypothetical protein|nr:MAG: hypothetical protein BWX91_01423 [Spirochaetes bacterium ADurb.Bin133]HNZ25717.1 DNRLRE domain-containing protein [Spirochaetota bacterium]HPY87195.1 DNRLRE domain-containing protein [Spirochaetota bacterium]
MKIVYILALFSIILSGCERKHIVPATKDAALLSGYPERNFSGKNLDKDLGYGAVKIIGDKKLTYPIMYLGSGSPDSIKDSFVLGGFDFRAISDKTITKAFLKFYVNYASSDRKNIIVFVRPILNDWDEEKVNYYSFYETKDSYSDLKDNVEKDEKLCKLIVFDIKSNEDKDFDEIPYPNSYREISINITAIVKYWIANPDKNFGLLIDPMWKTDLRYCATNSGGELSDFGIIEVATSEWYALNKKEISRNEMKYEVVKNKAYKKIKYIPRIELIYD